MPIFQLPEIVQPSSKDPIHQHLDLVCPLRKQGLRLDLIQTLPHHVGTGISQAAKLSRIFPSAGDIGQQSSLHQCPTLLTIKNSSKMSPLYLHYYFCAAIATNSPGGFYAAMPRLICHVKYFIGGQDGNILISKGGRLQPTEFIIRSMFEISHNDFNFTLDVNFNPSNIFHEDFPDVLNNLAHFEGSILRARGYEKLSVIHNSLGQRLIKLMHSLFEVVVNKEHPERDTASEVDADDNYSTDSDGLSSDFNITTWPVADQCKGHWQGLTSTHIICPLPAYDLDHNLILLSEYESKLKGALVEVYMAFCHHQVKSTKCDIFSAVLRELTILSPPAAMPSSPFKHRHLAASPLTIS
ncbi:uncharacterized protein EDB91DRAFT_1080908 [Suillus paluster]|uniref:uncharacterized protein n=1 Tax=Suillus paluster TaxID=48578 RepID=UPI001B882C48|nr:uncharacterized protein EDB91DRAFT_1080908 [Suillus paluster]KAG1744105.1 hypothetical protein EDB91DRAFT_1080908 [Suillus paluster]